jgi:hypothetical protein
MRDSFMKIFSFRNMRSHRGSDKVNAMDVPTLVFDFLAKNIFIESSAWEGMLS